ncbi:putative CDGSH iron-sulfur domain-containing protein [Naja naja]|nr:putative CDGSH iron-sulfur domain-containing protein [Naja naja]
MCSVSEWLWLLPFLGVLALRGYLAIRPFLPMKKQQKDSLINLKIQKDNTKVVNKINIEDLCHTKAVYCRCWRSKTSSSLPLVLLRRSLGPVSPIITAPVGAVIKIARKAIVKMYRPYFSSTLSL